jgi:conjugal transfer pilus assembly protein TraW
MRVRRCLILAVLALLVFGAGPGQDRKEGITDSAEEILRQAPERIKEFSNLASGIAQESPARMEEFEGVARALAEKNIMQVQEEGKSVARSLLPNEPGLFDKLPLPEAPKKTSRVLLFMTLGPEPDRNLEKNRRTVQEMDRDTVVVLKGLPHGKRSLSDLFRYIHQLAGDRRDPNYKEPRVMMDPRLYRQYKVELSPTLLYEQDGKAVAWVRGLVNGAWLKDQVEKEGRTGDLGKYGPTEMIAERDFLEEIEQRIASIDWEAKKDKAWKQYWTKYSFHPLPAAPRDRVFQVDAVFEVPQDFILPNGKVLAKKGERINLFDKVPPRFVLVVFDAGNPEQVAWAKEQGKEHRGRFRVQYLTTSLPERTWESFAKLEEVLQAPLYLLQENVGERFRLKHVPSVVKPLENCFEVREYKLEKGQGEKDVAQISR